MGWKFSNDGFCDGCGANGEPGNDCVACAEFDAKWNARAAEEAAKHECYFCGCPTDNPPEVMGRRFCTRDCLRGWAN